MNAVRWNILASMADKYASQAFAILTLAVMSRILTPSEIGVYLLANTVILLSENLRVFGVGMFVVQEKTLDRHMLRSVFTVSLFLSLGVAVLVFLTAEVIATHFSQPELAHLLRIATIGFVIAPFGNPFLALLQRELAFVRLAVLNVVAATITSAVTISLGALGVGAASYIWGFTAGSIALASGAVLSKSDFGLFRLNFTGTRRILSFGTMSSAITLFNMMYDMLPRLALAQFLGVNAVGVYGRAVTVCQLPERFLVSALQPVLLPAMAANFRAGRSMKATYLRSHTLMSAVQWPSLIMLAILADPIVRILLGTQWVEAAPLVRLIAISNMALAPAFMTFPVLVSVGRIRDTLYSTLISLPPSALLIGVASTFSLKVVAVSLIFIAPLQMLVALYFIRRAIDVNWTELLRASRLSVALAAGTAAIPIFVCVISPNGLQLSIPEATAAFTGGALGWVVTVLLTDHPIRGEIITIWRMLIVKLRDYRIPAGPTAL